MAPQAPCSLNAICHSTCARTSHDAALRPCWAAGACASAGPQTGLACIFIGTQFLQGWRGRWAAKATTNRQSAPFFCFPRSHCQATRGPHARGKRPETPNQCSSMGSKLSLMMPLQPQTHPATLPEPLYYESHRCHAKASCDHKRPVWTTTMLTNLQQAGKVRMHGAPEPHCDWRPVPRLKLEPQGGAGAVGWGRAGVGLSWGLGGWRKVHTSQICMGMV